jgi:hypothetical protein
LFPAPAALWPCLATAALIWVGESGRAAVTGWLAAAPLRWVGRLSFSLYLWHWPLLVLTRHLALDAPTALQAGLAVVLSVLLAWASLRWIETPVRRAAVSQRLLLWGGLGTLLFALAGAWGLTAVADQRAAQPGRAAQLRAGANDVSPDRRSCHLAGRLWLDYDARCRLGAAQAPRTLAVWGDSHGVELARALADHWAGQPDGRRVLQLTGSTCPPVLDFEAPMLPRCAQGNREVLARLAADPAVDTVLLAARYELYLKGPAARAFADGLASTVRSLHAAGKRVLLLDPVPTYDYPVPAALAQRWQRGEALALQGQTRAEYLARQAPALGLLARLASGGQARRVVVGERLCADARCRVVQEDQALYFDDNHLSMHGAAVIVPAVLRELPELDGAREGRVK